MLGELSVDTEVAQEGAKVRLSLPRMGGSGAAGATSEPGRIPQSPGGSSKIMRRGFWSLQRKQNDC